VAYVIVVFSDPVNNRDCVVSMADEWKWVWSIDVMILAGENRSTRKETWPSFTLSSTCLTWVVLVSNLGLSGEKPGLGNCVMCALDSSPRIEICRAEWISRLMGGVFGLLISVSWFEVFKSTNVTKLTHVYSQIYSVYQYAKFDNSRSTTRYCFVDQSNMFRPKVRHPLVHSQI
jgi:hypothetical protein